MLLKKLVLFLCLSAFSMYACAQEQLTEGILTYAVAISGKVPTPANEPALTETKSGTLTIYLKDDNIRQDIRFDDGYTYSRISNYTTDKDIILQTINTIRYAIEVSMKEERKKVAPFLNATVEQGKSRKNIGGLEAREATLKYKDGSTLALFYVNQYSLAHPEIFERAPELQGIPAQFDVPMSNGFTTHFELKTISREPVATATFRVPEGYRIISRKEYEKLIR